MPKRHILPLVAAVLLAVPALAVPAHAADDPGEALRVAAAKGDVETVRKLLEAGADPNAANQPYGVTALLYATKHENLEMVKLLVENGADVDQTDIFKGLPPIATAVWGDGAIAVFLIEHGLKDVDGALQMAVEAGSIRSVEALLATGRLSPDALSIALGEAQRMAQTGSMPLDAPAASKTTAARNAGEIAALLEKAGAKPPPPPRAFRLSPEVLARYEGTFVWPRQSETNLKVVNGVLTTSLPGGSPSPLEPTDATTFEGRGAVPFKLVFTVDGDAVRGFRFEQGGRTIDFVRKADEGAAETASAEEEKAEEMAEPGAATRDWPGFRGPNAAGTAAGNPPLEWNAEKGKNIQWKTAIPGRAHASPIVWGNRVFVATAVAFEGEGEFRPGVSFDMDSIEITSGYSWRLYALDKKSGAVVWERTAAEGRPRTARHFKATLANSTPVTDGEHVVAMMGSQGIFCYDFDGNLEWKKDLGTLDLGYYYDPTLQWGHGSSPIIYDGKVIVQVDSRGNPFIAAYAVADGKEIWHTQRDNLPSWGTPTLFETGRGAELVANGAKQIRAYDPKTGTELWSLGPTSEITVGTPVVGHGMVFVTGGRNPLHPLYAVRPGGRGDISLAEGTRSNDWVAWKYDTGGTDTPTPLVYGDFLYTVSNSGDLTSYDAETGELVYRERAADKGDVSITASPVAAAGRIYVTTEYGDVYVIKAGPKFERLAMNPLGEMVMATPAISGDVLFIRSLDHVFAIGREAPEEDAATSP